MTHGKQSPLVPHRRFPEFAENPEWDNAELGDLVETVNPPRKLTTSTYLEDGRFPVIDQSQSYICGWTNDDEAVITTPLPVIVFGDHTGVLKFVNQPFAQGADGIKILAARKSVSTVHLYHQLNYRPVMMEEYKRHFSTLKEKIVCFPELESGEQQKIADCLGSLDGLIAAEDRKLEILRQNKQGLMQQIFPQPGETVPRLRFPEFGSEPPWNDMALSTACDINPTHDGLPESFIYIDLESVKSGTLVERKEIERDNAPSWAQRLLRRKDILYQTVRSYQRNNLLFDIDDGYDYVASTGYAQLRAYGCPKFLYQLLHTNSFVNRVLSKCTGSNYSAINSSDLVDIRVPLPKLAEQQRIADCLSSLDVQIAAESERLEALRQHKQGLMQQLFPSLEENAQ